MNKYYINGMTLKEYCKKNKLNVNTQRNRIRIYIQNHPELSEEEAIKLALSKCGTCYSKYNYKGKTLSKYCKDNDEEYSKMISRVDSIISDNPNITPDKAVRIAIEEYTDNGIKYFYDDIPLIDYCKLHPEYSYSAILNFIRRQKEKLKNKTDQEIINSYFEIEHISHTYHFIDGIPLKDYCEEKEIDYRKVISNISRIRKENPNLSKDELVLSAVNRSLIVRDYLQYEGITLFQYCKENDLLYSSVYTLIYNLIKKENLSLDDAIEKSVKTIKRYGIKYYVGEIPLVEYCSYYNYNYSLVKDRILKNINKGMDQFSAIEETIEFYDRKKYINNLNNYFKLLQDNISVNVLYNILIFLNINFKNYELLISKGYSNKEAINLIWYFHDNEYNKELSISETKLNEVLKMKEKLINIDITYENIIKYDLLDLLGLYKTELFDTRYLIVLHNIKYIYKYINVYSDRYSLHLSAEEKQDIESELTIKILTAINSFNNNISKYLISYINKIIKGNIVSQILNRISQRNISLSQKIRNDDKSKTIEDTIAVPIKLELNFSNEFTCILNDLDELEKQFIVYKYQECYKDEEIKNILNLSETDLYMLNEYILEKLRKNTKVKKYFLKNI